MHPGWRWSWVLWTVPMGLALTPHWATSLAALILTVGLYTILIPLLRRRADDQHVQNVARTASSTGALPDSDTAASIRRP